MWQRPSWGVCRGMLRLLRILARPMPCRAVVDGCLLPCALLLILLPLGLEQAALSDTCLPLMLPWLLLLKGLSATRLRGPLRTAAMQWGASRGAATGSWWAAGAQISRWQQSAGACGPCMLLAGPRACTSLPAQLVKGLLLLAAGRRVYSRACWLLRRAEAPAAPLSVRFPALLLRAWLLLICRSGHALSMPLPGQERWSCRATHCSQLHTLQLGPLPSICAGSRNCQHQCRASRQAPSFWFCCHAPPEGLHAPIDPQAPG